jgi:protein TonB
LLAYQLSAPRDRTPLRRRASGLALALAVNLLLILVLLGMGKFAPGTQKPASAIVVELVRDIQKAAPRASPAKSEAHRTLAAQPKPVAKPPSVVLPSKPTIAQPHPSPFIEMSHDELAAADIGKLPKAGDGDSGDSEAVGRAPNGDVLYAAEWARHPTDAELGGYLPRNAPDGFGLVACKTIAEDRVEDCQEIDETPGSHLARAVREAAWQFRVRPPRKNGHPLIGSWVRIEIDYERVGG